MRDFVLAAARLILGEAYPSERVAVVQTLGGSGALKLGADFYSCVVSAS